MAAKSPMSRIETTASALRRARSEELPPTMMRGHEGSLAPHPFGVHWSGGGGKQIFDNRFVFRSATREHVCEVDRDRHSARLEQSAKRVHTMICNRRSVLSSLRCFTHEDLEVSVRKNDDCHAIQWAGIRIRAHGPDCVTIFDCVAGYVGGFCGHRRMGPRSHHFLSPRNKFRTLRGAPNAHRNDSYRPTSI